MARILVVDDEKAICTAYDGMLTTKHGHEVVCKHALKPAVAEIAAAIVAARPFDLVVTDMVMPDEENGERDNESAGLSVIEVAAKDPLTHITVLTGRGSLENVTIALDKGAAGYEQKTAGVADLCLKFHASAQRTVRSREIVAQLMVLPGTQEVLRELIERQRSYLGVLCELVDYMKEPQRLIDRGPSVLSGLRLVAGRLQKNKARTDDAKVVSAASVLIVDLLDIVENLAANCALYRDVDAKWQSRSNRRN